MQMNLSLFVTLATVLLGSTSAVSAAKIDHDKVQSIPQIVPRNADDRASFTFLPHMHVGNGCHVYPAVSPNGDYSGGLAPSGAPSAGCKDGGRGQVYVRSASFKGKWAIMYSWFWPKDEVSTGIGHRYDWEAVVVWIDNPNFDVPKILGVSTSQHHGWNKYTRIPPSDIVGGTHVKIQYSAEGVNSHALDITDKDGDTFPLITWESMSPAVRDGLAGHGGWGDANVPFINANFDDKLDAAYPF